MTAVDQTRELGLQAGGPTPVAPAPGASDGQPPVTPERSAPLLRWAWMSAAAFALGGLYAVGALLPFWFFSSPDAGAAFFPSAGVTLAALALTPRRTWPLFLAAVAVAEVAVDLTHGQAVPMALGFAAANVVEPLVGAATTRGLAPRVRSLRGRLLLFVSCAVLLGPMVGGAIGGLVA